MHEEYHRWYSPHIERDLEMLSFGHAGLPLILFPTSMGRYYENKDFKLIDAIHWFINNGFIKVYCPDGFDKMSWYNRHIHPSHKVLNHLAYEKMILNEVIPKAQWDTGQYKMIVAGCSFGGYHAANIAFRHPYRFRYVISMGGAFDIKQFLGGYFDDNCYFNNPVDYMDNLNSGYYYDEIKKMGIILGTGEYDICKDQNYRLSGILHKNNIPHWIDCPAGAKHDWQWWHEAFSRYLGEVVRKEN